MGLFTVEEMAFILDGAFLGNGELSFFSAVVDSREAREGTLFVPLKGVRTDGHLFFQAAFDNGARLFLFDRMRMDTAEISFVVNSLVLDGASFVLVDDPLFALQRLAMVYLEGFPDLIRIGITGSSGKTTSKELLGAILSQNFRVSMSVGNFNSEIGLPMMALRVREGDEVLLLEMGIDHVGEMDRMVSILKPQYALITCIGTAHIGIFGSHEKIAQEKGRIFSLFDDSCKGFVFEGDALAFKEKKRYSGDLLFYGSSSTGFKAEDEALLGWRLTSMVGEVGQLPLFGFYNLNNFYGAERVARELGLSDSQILVGAALVEPLFGRGKVLDFKGRGGGITLIEDCYNANGESVSAGVEFFGGLLVAGRKCLVLGAMKELGAMSEGIHRDIGRKLLVLLDRGGVDCVYLFGEETLWVYDELENSRCKNRFTYVKDMDALRDEVADEIQHGDVWMLKGSRSMALERLESVFSNFCD